MHTLGRAIAARVLALVAVVAVGCSTSTTDAPPTPVLPKVLAGFRLPASAAVKAYPPGPSVSACGFCADVGGKNDVKKLCTQSKQAWDTMVEAICSTKCAPECSADWCARLGDVTYSNASAACNDCAVAKCWPEISSCSSAQ